MSDYSAWGVKPGGSKDPHVPGQKSLPKTAPDPVKVILETKEDTARIDRKLDELMEPTEEGEDKLSQILQLIQAQTLKIEAIEARQVRLEKAVLTSMDAIKLALTRVGSVSKI